MSAEIFSRSVSVLQALGIGDVRLTGGEPTVHPLFDQFTKELTKKGIRVGLATNGLRLLWRADVEAMLKSLSRCWVSIYGPTEESHAWIQSHNRKISSARTIKKVGDLTKRGCNLGLSVLVTPGTTMHVRALLAQCASVGVRAIRLIAFQDDGRGRGLFRNSLAEWQKEFLQLGENLSIWPEAGAIEQIRISGLFDTEQAPGGLGRSCLLRERRMWTITHDGAVYPCCFTAYEERVAVGHVSEHDLVERLSRSDMAPHAHPPCCTIYGNGRWGDSNADLRCPISIRERVRPAGLDKRT